MMTGLIGSNKIILVVIKGYFVVNFYKKCTRIVGEVISVLVKIKVKTKI